MSRVKSKKIRISNIAYKLLHYSARNYLSARILYLNNRLFDAGLISHEAIEKVIKALLYFKKETAEYENNHNLNFLMNILINNYGYENLKGSKNISKFYEDCYSFRYPNRKPPKTFSTSTWDFKNLDTVYSYFHDECLKEIIDDNIKYSSGIFIECLGYFKNQQPVLINNLILSNDKFTIEYVNNARDYWVNKGCYVKDGNGTFVDLYGTIYQNF